MTNWEPTDRRALRLVFDLDADAYDQTRPVLPDSIFDNLVELARLAPGNRVLEIGCGTGQATRPLGERGLAVTAIELGPELAARARANLRAFPSVEVVTSAFESWTPPAERFDAVVSVNALHWIDPAVRYAKPAQLLVPAGAMVVAACKWARPANADPFLFAVDDDYRSVGELGDPPPEPDAIGPWHFPPDAREHFVEVAARRSPFEIRFTANQYLRNLATQSGVRKLGDERTRDLLARVSARLDAMGRREVTRSLVALLTVGRLRG